MSGHRFPKVGAVFDVRGFIDIGRATGGDAVVHGGEEAAAILFCQAVFRIGFVVDEPGEAAGVALHHDGHDADTVGQAIEERDELAHA